MKRNLKRLIKKEASRPMSMARPQLSEHLLELAGPLAGEYQEMLNAKNGFYAYAGSLHVYSSGRAGAVDQEHSLEDWNDPGLWIDRFQGAADGALFFAQDIFAVQHALKDGEVWTFEPEEGTFEPFASSLDDWAKLLMDDPENELGWGLAEHWLSDRGGLRRGDRLAPSAPWASNADFSKMEFGAVPMLERVRFGAEIWNATKDLPEGQGLLITFVDD